MQKSELKEKYPIVYKVFFSYQEQEGSGYEKFKQAQLRIQGKLSTKNK